ncbi:MAG: ATP-binding protein [bacterium]
MKTKRWFQGLPSIRAFGGGGGRRLVRGYFLISVLLISGGLITSGLLEIYFRYFENLEQIGLLQREVALGASFKIEQFAQEIKRTMKGVTKSRQIVLKGLTPEYKFELRKLLLIAPPITEAVAIDKAGTARTQVSRLRTILPGDRRDLSASAAFKRARQGKSYFGPVYFVRGSEPYMTIAVPIERFAGEVIGVLRAEVNLKYIWEVISGIRIGKGGYAYAVSRSGDLIAHPKISLVLQRQNLSRLGQVKAAFSGSGPVAAGTSGIVGENLEGEKVFSSHALVPGLNWAVIIEQPVEEAYKKLYASLFRTSSLILLGIGTALLASLFVARRVVRPLRALREGVERIGGGDLDFRLDLKTGDEIEDLADEFNKMSADLQEAYTGLEQKVEERTRELMVANQKLNDASRHKSEFLANMSHELRTPLNSIMGFTRLVLRRSGEQLPEVQQENLKKVLASSDHLLNLINDLLDLSKIEAGRMEVFAENFEIEEVLLPAASTVEPMLRSDRVELVRDIKPDIPTLHTDRDKLRQIVLNLLSNAVKFTEKGEVRLSALSDNGMLNISVSDTGIGINPESVEKVFEDFQQADMSSTRKYGGTGLGLAIVKRLAILLGGDVGVVSELGKGTEFTLSIPVNCPAEQHTKA